MSTPLSINPDLSPPPPLSTSSSASSSVPRTLFSLRISNICAPRAKPICRIRSKSHSLLSERPNSGRLKRSSISASDMTITEFRDEEEDPPPLLESEISSKPRRIVLFVEPSPFAYVSGYKNRFQNFIRYLREMGDEVPQEFYGAKLIGSRSFPCPLYQKVPLSLALSPRIISEVARFKPDIIHASSPGIMVFGALIIAKLLCVPLVMSYHTHVPVYIPRYTFSWLVKPMWLVIKFLHRAADLTLVPSAALRKELEAARVTAANKIRLWNKGVDSESFHPQYRCHEMRLRLSNGEPEKPLIVHVGRLGVEKSLDLLKRVMDQLPEARIAFIGDGPYRGDLEKLFSGMPAVFTGMLGGEELSQAYASGDVFVMPSESETLGLVVLEAMSSGLPVVAARAGGLIDIIPEDQEGKTGFCLSPETLTTVAATKTIRNEQYNAAIWFWRKKRAQLLRPFQWLFRRAFQAPEVNY
ncbi:sulfoquinovosyldiacylglycerol 2 [Actinidia rufa]|uniref:Sulfoquinovosyldiacylglycerol 2 n=1 Tax=Actinidia rufa TaxID=165716 RepID=A0A7J0E7E0_9ERIC|nr:sulfoquinovosyldiacylglycerol 2 [Actinidia rufa]